MKRFKKIFTWLVLFAVISSGVVAYGAGSIDFDNVISEGCDTGTSSTVGWGCSIGLGTVTNMITTSTTSMTMNKLAEVGTTCKDNPDAEVCKTAANSTGLLQYALKTIEDPEKYLTPPVSFEYYVDKTINNNLLSKPVYAVTFGGGALDVVYSVWQYFRNLAYLIFVVVIIAVGFMVMFRKQLDPRTVVTVQSAIPNFFIVLLLITFSYGIGSLAVASIGPLYGALKDVGSLGSVNGTLGGFLVLFIIGLVQVFFVSAIAPIVGISLMIVFLIFLLSFLLGWIMYGIEYIKRLAKLIILTVLAPIILLFGAIPGQGHFIGHWFKAIIANVLALPLMYMVFKIGVMLILTDGPNVALHDIGAGFLHIAMGIIVIFWSAKIPKMVEDMFGYDGSIIPSGEKRH